MRVAAKSSIDISESLTSFLLAGHIHHTKECDPLFENRMDHVNTAKYTIADVYLPRGKVAFEVKSREHGTSALKGVIQASIYLEQANKSILVMQRPRRRRLTEVLETMCESFGVGLMWVVGVPSICSEDIIKSATGGNAKPFRMWKERRYTSTRDAIKARSRTEYIDEYINTLEKVVEEKSDNIFEYAVRPKQNANGLYTKFAE
jgi:hypothetical protein